MSGALIVLIPGLLSLWMVRAYSAERAFLSVYLPVLLLIPDSYRLPIPGLPDPSFSEAALLPIAAVLFWQIVKGRWRLSALDGVMLSFAVWIFISELFNAGWGDAQNMFFDTLLLAVVPYMAGKALIEPTGMRVPVARRIVWLLFIVCVISVYEFRMGASLIRPALNLFFRGTEYNEPNVGIQLRWGFGRIAGPYPHAIIMGTIIASAWFLHRWLVRTGHWERDFRWLPGLPFRKSTIIGCVLIAGSLMTMSRGPWLAAAGGMVFAWVGTSRRPRRALLQGVVLLVVAGLVLSEVGKTYGSTEDGATEEQSSAAYRKVLVAEYTDIVMQRSVWGWGRAGWPRVPGMPSIDNWYLLLALMHGITGSILFIVMTGTAAVRLLWHGLRRDLVDPDERAFIFTLAAVLISIMMSVTTVYLGGQSYTLLFLFLGWSEGCVLAKPGTLLARAPEDVVERYQFARVIA